ncbi:hypothetical protein [Iningainema tapete]|uniref:Uncharacterized protein n=1 Tax=Iningainema tapete BLCC-T55 TaxID=2748662 RepID=A0A8J7C9K5_9CYAN|nr:hypothetical protein [Iningainema tapete]MBD2771045.1 hypothetical protein [Iningainema tapete BLCC-T55]
MTAKRERTFIQIQIDPGVKSKFTSKVEQEGKKITDVILRMIEDYIDETEKVDLVDLKQRVEALENALKENNSRLVGESRA